jgi:hypothetical protein
MASLSLNKWLVDREIDQWERPIFFCSYMVILFFLSPLHDGWECDPFFSFMHTSLYYCLASDVLDHRRNSNHHMYFIWVQDLQ